MASSIVSLVPQPMSPGQWQAVRQSQAQIPLIQAQTQSQQTENQQRQIQNQILMNQMKGYQALSSAIQGISGTPGQTTPSSGSPMPSSGQYPVMPAGSGQTAKPGLVVRDPALINRNENFPQGAASPGWHETFVAPSNQNQPASAGLPTPGQAAGATQAPNPPAAVAPQAQTGPQIQPAPQPNAAPVSTPRAAPSVLDPSTRLHALFSDPISMARVGVPLPMAMSIAKDYGGIANEMQGLTDKQRAEFTEMHAQANAPLQALLDPNITPDAAQQALDQHNALMDKVVAQYPRFGQFVPRLPDQFSQDPQTFQVQKQNAIAQTGLSTQASELAAKAATTRETTAKAAQQELMTGQMQRAIQGDQQANTTANGEAAIHSAFNPPGSKESIDRTAENAFVQQYRTAPRIPSAEDPTGVKAGQAVLTAAVAHAGQIGMRTSPTVQAAEAAQAAQTAAATNPYKIKEAQATESYRNALAQGDTARAQYYDSLKDLNQSLGTAQTIGKVVQLSQGEHNEIAASQLKAMVPEFTNAIQNIKRMAASQGDKGMGSVAAHLESEFTSLTQGKPLTDTLIKEIQPYVQTIANGATLQHNGNVAAIKKAYPNANYKPETLPYAAQAAHQGGAAPANGGHQVGDSVMWRGQIRTIAGFDGKGNAILK